MTNIKMYIGIAVLLLLSGIGMLVTATEAVDRSMALSLIVMSGVFVYLYKQKREANDD